MPVPVAMERAFHSIRLLPRSLSSGFFFLLFFLGSLGLGGLFLLLFFLELGAEQFEDGELRAVADAEAGVDDARVTAGAIGKARGEIGEKFLGGPGGHEIGGGLAARLQRVALAKSNHILDKRLGGLRARDRGGDAFFLDNVGYEVAERGAAMRRLAPEFRSVIAVSHT